MPRAHREHYTLYPSEGLVHGLEFEGREDDRWFGRVACFNSLLADRSIPAPFGRRLNRYGNPDTPPITGSSEEAWQTALVVGYPGGLGSCLRRRE